MGNLISALEKADTSAYPFSTMKFIPASGINFRIANSRMRWRCNFYKARTEWGRADLKKNVRASL